MCYSVKTLIESQLKRALRNGAFQDAEQLRLHLTEIGATNLYHASGFSHPGMFIYPDCKSEPIYATWGLVPFWVKDNAAKLKIWNNTLNARAESIFEKPAYRESAKSKRCLIYLDGFYEYHHSGGKAYPFFIRRIDSELLCVAGLWSEWHDKENHRTLQSFSIVTTVGNHLLAKIHNNPKLDGSRMLMILPDELAEDWINPDKSQAELKSLLLPYPDELLHAHSVLPISGKLSKRKVPEADDEFSYPELVDFKF